MSDINIADMSDEDFAKLDEATLLNADSTSMNNATDGVVVDEVVEPNNGEVNEDQSQGKQESEAEPVAPIDATGDKVEDTSATEVKEPKQEAKAPETPKPEDKEKKDDEPKQAEPVNAETQLAALFAPIKANGRETKIESIEEARQLISMGLGFNKKMGELKRAKRIEKLLDVSKIDETRLSFLIDVSMNKPEAISKLIQESGIDALDLGVDVAEKYTPSVHSVSDKEIAIDEVLNELRGSPTVAKTLDVVTKEWDKASRDVISDDPELLKVIDGHMQDGAYELITGEVDRLSALGKLKGLSNIQAYHQVGDAMHKAGKFAHIYGSSVDSQQTTKPEPIVVQPKVKQADDDEQRAARRKAASGTPPAASVTKPALTKSLLDMSPEEFAKFNPTSI